MELIEFQHCLDQETADDTIRLLEKAGIAYRKSTGQPTLDVSILGNTSETANQRIIISIYPADYQKARELFEADALLIDLPDGHHLSWATPGELREILCEADSWSPFDVAHARRLLKEQGIEPEAPEELAERHLAKLRAGKKVPLALLVLSVVLPILGALTTITLKSIIGCGIALSITFMKGKTVEGRYFIYDKKSRDLGLIASILAIGITLVGIYLWGRYTHYGDYDLYVPN